MKGPTTNSRRWRRTQAFLWRTYYSAPTLKEVIPLIGTRIYIMFDRIGIDSAFSRWSKPTSTPLTEIASSDPIRETAALSIDEPDVCPYCQKAMRRSLAVGLAVFVCDDDRYVAPCPNDYYEV